MHNTEYHNKNPQVNIQGVLKLNSHNLYDFSDTPYFYGIYGDDEQLHVDQRYIFTATETDRLTKKTITYHTPPIYMLQ